MHIERENPSVLAKVTQVSDVAYGPLVVLAYHLFHFENKLTLLSSFDEDCISVREGAKFTLDDYRLKNENFQVQPLCIEGWYTYSLYLN
jgi:hypothetical protein